MWGVSYFEEEVAGKMTSEQTLKGGEERATQISTEEHHRQMGQPGRRPHAGVFLQCLQNSKEKSEARAKVRVESKVKEVVQGLGS